MSGPPAQERPAQVDHHPTPAEGRYFEDFNVGDVYRHSLGRTITDTDNMWFTLLTGNTNQLHFNQQYAESSRWGRMLVNSTLTLAVVVGLSVRDVSQHAVANLGWKEINLRHPVFAGDTLWAESLVIETRPSRSRPEVGIVTVETRGLNQHGDVCIDYVRSVMVQRAAHRTDDGVFPQARSPFRHGGDDETQRDRSE